MYDSPEVYLRLNVKHSYLCAQMNELCIGLLGKGFSDDFEKVRGGLASRKGNAGGALKGSRYGFRELFQTQPGILQTA